MSIVELEKTANSLIANGRGILAADESSSTIKKRFDAIGVESTEINRRDYREMLLRTPGIGEHLSGVILYDETIWQSAADGTPLVELIENAGLIPGIKVDEGTETLVWSSEETITKGLDQLSKRLPKYYERGARFAKWRAVIKIGADMPSYNCLHSNAHALARYAALCQQANIVPIVEPEVLTDGHHGIDRCYEVTARALQETYRELFYANVALEGTLLKPGMIIQGQDASRKASVEEVAEKTIKCLRASVPAAVPGIAFLSGGQSDEDATRHLNQMNQIPDLPWKLTFSFGRALQTATQKVWCGKKSNVDRAQRTFAHRARMNALAAFGDWSPTLEREAA